MLPRHELVSVGSSAWFGEVFMSVRLIIRDVPARGRTTATQPAAAPGSTPHIRRSRAAAMSKARRSKPRSMPATPRSASNACSTSESPRVSVRENRAYARFSGRAKSAPIASNRLISCWSCAGGKRPSGSTNTGRVSCALRRTIECTHAGLRATAFNNAIDRRWVARFVRRESLLRSSASG
jgi:hypothetical protein